MRKRVEESAALLLWTHFSYKSMILTNRHTQCGHLPNSNQNNQLKLAPFDRGEHYKQECCLQTLHFFDCRHPITHHTPGIPLPATCMLDILETPMTATLAAIRAIQATLAEVVSSRLHLMPCSCSPTQIATTNHPYTTWYKQVKYTNSYSLCANLK